MASRMNAIPTTVILGPNALNLCDRAVKNKTVARKTVILYIVIGIFAGLYALIKSRQLPAQTAWRTE